MEIGPLQPTTEKVNLYNRHKRLRGLGQGEKPIDLDGYEAFLGETCCDSVEIRYRLNDMLVGVAITDRSKDALSAVYCYYDPGLPALSIGAFSILKQLDLCRQWGLRYLYLGLYIQECSAMAYKSSYYPHERYLAGRWQTFARP